MVQYFEFINVILLPFTVIKASLNFYFNRILGHKKHEIFNQNTLTNLPKNQIIIQYPSTQKHSFLVQIITGIKKTSDLNGLRLKKQSFAYFLLHIFKGIVDDQFQMVFVRL